MAQKSLYILTVRAILTVLVLVFLTGALGGAISSWLVTKNLLRGQGGGNRVIERVETVSGSADVFASVVNNVKSGVVGLMNDNGQMIETGVVLTADGIMVAPNNSALPRSPQVLFADGSVKPAAFLRAYPEKGVVFMRLSGNFPPPVIAADDMLSSARQGVFIRTVPGASRIGARNAVIENFSYGGKSKNLAWEKYGKLVQSPGNNYYGSPMFSDNQELLGMLVDYEEGTVLPASELNSMLQDLLKYPTNETVSVMKGLEGQWKTQQTPNKEKIESVFEVSTLSASSIFANGLKNGDSIVAINDKPFPSATLWFSVLDGARTGKTVSVTIRRDNQEQRVVVNPTIEDAKTN